MKILGIHESADSGACLLIDGQVVASISEERFTREKNDWGWPSKAIEFCLRSANLKSIDLDNVAIASKAINPIEMKIKRSNSFGIKDYLRENELYWKPIYMKKKIKTITKYLKTMK